MKKPSDWPSECPAWCLVVFDRGEEGRKQAWKLVAEALRSGAVYAPRSEDGRILEADRSFLEQWIEQRVTSSEGE